MSQLTEDDARLLELANDSSDDSDVPVDARCKYPSKYCGNARAAKTSGKLHRFCEFHRRRANVNQKRWTAVRRQIPRESRTMQQHHLDAMLLEPTWAAMYDMSQAIPPRLVPTMEAIYKDEAGLVPLDENDIQILTALLDDDSDSWGIATDASHGRGEGQSSAV